MGIQNFKNIISEIPAELYIIIAWRKIVGKQLSKICIPSVIKNETLTIYTKNSAWTYELSFYKKSIIHKVNKILENPIKNIRISTSTYIRNAKKIKKNKEIKIAPIDKNNPFVETGTFTISDKKIKSVAEKVLWKSICIAENKKLKKHHLS